MDERIGPTDAELAQLRVDAAASERRNRAFSNESDARDTSFFGLIVQFAERKEEVAIKIAGSEALRGRIISVGPDAVMFDVVPQLQTMLIRTDAISAITSEGQQILSAPNPSTTGTKFIEKLEDWIGSQAELHLRSGEVLAGRLASVGADVVTMRHALRDGVSYVPVQTLAGCRLR